MTKQSNHTQKTQDQRRVYNRYIQKLDYEPTVNEGLSFADSTQPGEELAESTSKRKRPLNKSERVKDHFRENWINWALGTIAVVFLWFMGDAKVDIARIATSLGYQNTDLSDIKRSAQKNAEKNVGQDLMLNEHKFRIEFLEKNIDSKK